MTSSILKGMGIQNIKGSLPASFQAPVLQPKQAEGFSNALQAAAQGQESKMHRPVAGDVLRGFGPGHPGVDFKSDLGSPVRSAAGGVVESSGWVGGYGNLLVVRHQDNVRAYYAHLSESQVHPGQQVEAGQNIGLSGNSGDAPQPHLHFELRKSGRPVDPLPRLGDSFEG